MLVLEMELLFFSHFRNGGFGNGVLFAVEMELCD